MHTFGPFCYEFENVEEEIVDVCGEHRTAVVDSIKVNLIQIGMFETTSYLG